MNIGSCVIKLVECCYLPPLKWLDRSSVGQRLPGLRGDGRAAHGDVAGTPAQTLEGQAILAPVVWTSQGSPETQRWWEEKWQEVCIYLERFVLRNCSPDCEVKVQSQSGDPGKSCSSTPKAVCWQNFFWLKLSLCSLKSSTNFESHPHYGRLSAVLKIYSFKC